MKNKITAIVLTLMMVLTCLPMGAFAALAGTYATPTIEVETKYAASDSEVSVNINVYNNPGIAGATLAVSYSNKLTLVDAVAGDTFSALDFMKPGVYANPCNFSWDSENAEVAEDGTLLSLTFAVSSEAVANEELPINISYRKGDIYDTALNNVDFDIVNGVISVIDYIPGDVNSDQVVNGKDVTLLRRFNVGGYGVTINEAAADVNDDDAINGKDVTLIRRYNVGGYGVELLPHHERCHHELTAVAAVAATCTKAGNIAYWHCSVCDGYFSDEDARAEISIEETVIAAKGHAAVVDPAVAPTETSVGYTEGSHCSVCNEVLVAQEEIPMLKPQTASITYRLVNNDNYLASQEINNPNPDTYVIGKGETLSNDISVPGYTFVGWFDSFADNATQITSISASETKNITLYAHWTENIYDITYKLYQTPLGQITDEKYLHYTVSKGLSDLPNPTLYNYVFLGWYTDDGEEITSITTGTVGDIILNAYWTSKRNICKSIPLSQPIVLTDSAENVIYFAYELGTIENIPVSENIWTIQSVSGLSQQVSQTVTTSITKTQAQTISDTISNSTVDSSTWTLSSDWNDVTSVNETWAHENGMEVDEAETIVKTESDLYSFTSSNGGGSSHTDNTGTSTLGYGSKNAKTGTETLDENTAELDVNIHAEYKTEGLVKEIAGGWTIGGDVDVNHGWKDSTTKYNTTDKKSGSDTTTLDTHVDSTTSSWNNSETSQRTNTASTSTSVNKALSEIISTTKGYGSSYSTGGENSQTQNESSTESRSVNSSSTLTYSEADTKSKTTTYSVDGKTEGCYRLVIAGTAHVYGVVGYDIATNSYFTYTYSVMDDKTYEFLDYSPDLKFNDCEYCVLPFEVPYYVCQYVNSETLHTSGLQFKTNTSSKTASVIGYSGSDTDVIVPAYISAGGVAYKVTGISSSAFAGKNIRAISLGKYIEEIPDAAFMNCSALEEISGCFTKIGNEAFSGCSSLENFTVSDYVASIGTDAFENVPGISVKAISTDNAISNAVKGLTESEKNLYQAMQDKEAKDYTAEETALYQKIIGIAMNDTQLLINSALSSGADKIVLDISNIVDGTPLTLDIPEIDYFELDGKKKTYADLYIRSAAQTTVLNDITITDSLGIPLAVSSSALILNAVSINSTGFCMTLGAESTEITLLRDSILLSEIGKAIVCQNVNLKSEIQESTVGILNVHGNIYTSGEVSNTAYLDISAGEIISISQDDYVKYLKGTFIVSFDANDGSITEASKSAYCYSPVGELPTPTRQYYTFDGWYTEKDGGTLVTAETVFDDVKDVTLYAHWTLNSFVVTFNANGGNVSTSTLRGYCGQNLGTLPTPTRDYYTFDGWYTEASGGTKVTASTQYSTAQDITVYAHWMQKSVSDWVKRSEMPSDAQVVSQKWSYTQRSYKESGNSSESGWTKYDTQRTSWGTKQGPVYSDPSNGSRNVTSERYVSSTTKHYKYYHRTNGSLWGTDGTASGWARHNIDLTYALTAGYYDSTYNIQFYKTYKCPSCGNDHMWVPDGTYNEDHYSTRWYYQEPVYTYYYYQDNNKESSSYPSGSDISNIVEWVQYRAK